MDRVARLYESSATDAYSVISRDSLIRQINRSPIPFTYEIFRVYNSTHCCVL